MKSIGLLLFVFTFGISAWGYSEADLKRDLVKSCVQDAQSVSGLHARKVVRTELISVGGPVHRYSVCVKMSSNAFCRCFVNNGGWSVEGSIETTCDYPGDRDYGFHCN